MVPKYPPICTRMLVDNNWCTMMLEENVTLINSRAKEIGKNEVFGPNGEAVPADVIIYATGFQSTRFCTASLKVFGKGGVELSEDWGLEPTAYLGLTRPNFPNFFMTYGPNTNVSSGGSIIWCAEIAGRYIGECVASMLRKGYKRVGRKARSPWWVQSLPHPGRVQFSMNLEYPRVCLKPRDGSFGHTPEY